MNTAAQYRGAKGLSVGEEGREGPSVCDIEVKSLSMARDDVGRVVGDPGKDRQEVIFQVFLERRAEDMSVGG